MGGNKKYKIKYLSKSCSYNICLMKTITIFIFYLYSLKKGGFLTIRGPLGDPFSKRVPLGTRVP